MTSDFCKCYDLEKFKRLQNSGATKGKRRKLLKTKTNILLDSQKARLFERITRIVGEKLSFLITEAGGWKQKEIHQHIGIPESRQSEYKDFEKYGRRISLRDLSLCLSGGIINVAQLIDNCANNEKETEYLKTLLIYENVKLQEIVKNLQSVGLDPTGILEKEWEKYKSKK